MQRRLPFLASWSKGFSCSHLPIIIHLQHMIVINILILNLKTNSNETSNTHIWSNSQYNLCSPIYSTKNIRQEWNFRMCCPQCFFHRFSLCITNHYATETTWHVNLSDHVTRFRHLYWPGRTTNKQKHIKTKHSQTRRVYNTRAVSSPLSYNKISNLERI